MRFALFLLLTLALPALAAPQGTPPQPGAGQQQGGGQQQLSPADQKAIHDYRLTPQNVEKLLAAGKRLREATEKDPSIRERDRGQGKTKTLDESVKRIESNPGMQGALRSAGVDAREFVVGTFAMVTSVMWATVKKSNPQAPAPGYVNPENIRFIEQHPEVTQKWHETWRDAEGGHAGAHKEQPADGK